MLFRQGQNCWKLAQADRVAFLVDGEAYFRAVADACQAARRAIYIIGWDIDSRIRLRREGPASQETLAPFLDRLARATPELNIYLLEWNFSMLYSLEREFWPLLSFGWQTHRRVHFELDENHPVGASHHQKIVVVDDRVAFVGGFDLASCRWDTSAHAAEQPERCDNGASYGPIHDVQMMVDGAAAKLLGDLARRRWELATGDLPAPIAPLENDPWPQDVSAALTHAEVAVLRTEPKYDGKPEIREIERFFLDAIRQARRTIYIENQYLTSVAVGAALAAALSKPEGPEILIILPKKCSGWLEQETMGTLRQRLLGSLQQVDKQRRLMVLSPDRQGLGEKFINVHSKLLIVDDLLLTIGSANLNNRSLGFDSECNLALAADRQEHVGPAIAGLRNRLLAEHLGTDPATIASHYRESGSLLATVAALNDGERHLRELPALPAHGFSELFSAELIVDPERPLNLEELLDYLDLEPRPEQGKGSARNKARRFIAVITLALVMAALWRWSPLRDWLTLDRLLAATAVLRNSPLAIPLVLASYVIGSCLMFPVTLLILVTALSFGPLLGFVLALSGSLLGGLASYSLGRWLGREVVRKLAGRKVNRLSRKLARRGWQAMALVRIVPIAPYTIVNLVAGSTHISVRSFLIGTFAGMTPGILAINIFGGGLERAIRQPDWGTAAVALMALLGAALVLVLGKRWLLDRDQNHAD